MYLLYTLVSAWNTFHPAATEKLFQNHFISGTGTGTGTCYWHNYVYCPSFKAKTADLHKHCAVRVSLT
jgi:hypothetical protein